MIDRQDLTDTSYTPQSPLESNTVFILAGRAVNACGTSSFSEAFDFETDLKPEIVMSLNLTQVIYQNDFESDNSDWVIDSPTVELYLGQKCKQIISQLILFTPPTGLSFRSAANCQAIPYSTRIQKMRLLVRFRQWRRYGNNSRVHAYDAGILEYSTDNGSAWKPIPEDWFLSR